MNETDVEAAEERAEAERARRDANTYGVGFVVKVNGRWRRISPLDVRVYSSTGQLLASQIGPVPEHRS